LNVAGTTSHTSAALGAAPQAPEHRPPSDFPFLICLAAISGAYVILIVWLLAADTAFTSWGQLGQTMADPHILYSIKLSLISCTVTALLSVFVAVPLGYMLSRFLMPSPSARGGALATGWRWPRHIIGTLVDAILDIPIVLPPLVIGLSLLIFFQTRVGKLAERVFSKVAAPTLIYVLIPLIMAAGLGWCGHRVYIGFRTPGRPGTFQRLTGLLLWLGLALLTAYFASPLRDWAYAALGQGITFEVPAVILAQFMVACAFAVRTMRVTFDQIHPRREQVALTLGCSRGQAFRYVVLPEARRGIIAAAILAWARALGEFGPILVFAGATSMRTEVLSTSVFLELSIGRIEGAVAVSMIMVVAALIVLVTTRLFGLRTDALGAAFPARTAGAP
jgi:molybdate transport system permease protein